MGSREAFFENFQTKVCRGPVFVTDQPASLKPFYMRVNNVDEDPGEN